MVASNYYFSYKPFECKNRTGKCLHNNETGKVIDLWEREAPEIEVGSIEDIEEVFNKYYDNCTKDRGKYRFDYWTAFDAIIGCPLIYTDPRTMELVKMYSFCHNDPLKAFPAGSFGEVPHIWIEAVETIRSQYEATHMRMM